MKTCVISLQKDNDRLQEWIDHYLGLGFNHIFLIDNNDINNKLILDNDNVTVLPWNGINMVKVSLWMQNVAYEYALKYINYLGYDYGFFCDSDEYLVLKHHPNISEFIQQYLIQKNRNWIAFYWDTYDDNNLIYINEEKDTLMNTYTRPQSKFERFKSNNEAGVGKVLAQIKPQLRVWIGHTVVDEQYKDLQPDNKNYNHDKVYCNANIAVINHYRTRCMEWYLQTKVKRLYYTITHDRFGKNALDGYILFNQMNKEKLNKFFELYYQILGKEFQDKEKYLNLYE